jgi:hypothetical protein
MFGHKPDEDENFVPLTEQEMEDFKSEVWYGFAIGEHTEAEAANMILYEAHINGLIEE